LCRPGDRWHLGSNGKAMTATLIARLVERGALAWTAPLDRMLPQLAATMNPSYRDVTLPDLLSHRSGLPENHGDTAFFETFYADRAPAPAQRLRYVGSALTQAPAAVKRLFPSYSNTGLLVAAACAEHATGRPFEALIRAELFRPLGMDSPSFDQFGGAGEPSGHVDGRPADRERDPNPRMFAPAGAMRMTLGDWSLFCIDQMQGEHGRGRLLRAETYRFLHAGQGGTSSALGWGAAPSPMGLRGPALTHAGSDGNWYALVVLFPQSGNGVLIAANAGHSMGGDHAASAAIRALAAPLAPAAVATP
jgi:CubicO group peptidase (beta-lactamase class C family)